MSTTVVAPREGKSYWLVQERTTPLTRREQTGEGFEVFAVDAQPNGGPPPHIHRREDELFYVVDGTFDFAFKDHVVRATAGAAVFLPRGVLHTYNNVGDCPGRLLVTSMPANFTRFVADAGEPCTGDPTRPPAIGPATFEKLGAACAKHGIEMHPDWKPTAAAPPATKPPELWVTGLHIRMLLTSPDTMDSFSVAEITAWPGGFVPPHTHRREDEFFYVLDGTFEFELERRKTAAPAGTFIHVPRQTLHGFRNASDRPARLVDYHTPGGFEKFFEAAGTVCHDVKLGPPKVAPDLEKFIRVCNEHGMEVAPLQPA